MFEVFFRDKLAPLALRLALGTVFAAHGYAKIMANGGTAWTSGLGELPVRGGGQRLRRRIALREGHAGPLRARRAVD